MSHARNTLQVEPGESENTEIILIVMENTSALDFHENIEHNTEHGYIEDTLLDQEEFKGLLQCKYCSKNIILGNDGKCHTDGNLVYCELCLKFFSQNRDLKKHIKTHENSDMTDMGALKLKPEADCKLSNIQDSAVLRTTEKYECPCSRIFKRQYHYEKHMLTVHGKTYQYGSGDTCRSSEISLLDDDDDDDSHKCTVCLKIFKHKNSLRAHLKVHSKNMYKCPECSKVITTKGWFEQHIKMHGTARPFQCSVCKKSFPDEKRLKRHEYIHGTSIFKCSMCSAQFTHKYLLLDHNKIHLTGSNSNNDHHLRVLHSKVKLGR